jgi:hypothetical protein
LTGKMLPKTNKQTKTKTTIKTTTTTTKTKTKTKTTTTTTSHSANRFTKLIRHFCLFSDLHILHYYGFDVRRRTCLPDSENTIGVRRDMSNGVEDGHRPTVLRAGHPMVIEGLCMAGPSDTLGSQWPPLAIRPRCLLDPENTLG